MARMLAYIRVSTAKQGDGVSLEQQKASIEQHANTRQHSIVHWYEEKRTAAKSGRPAFKALLKRLRAGRVDGVIIHKVDRGARNLRDWADISDLIDAGVKVEFAHENLDLTTRGGRLSADLQAAIAADYIRNLREETIKGIYGRLKQGIFPFPAPVGYLNSGKGNPKAVDTEKASLVREAFKLYSTGDYSLNSLRHTMSDKGLVRSSGNPLCKNGISRMLRNPFYMGLMKVQRTGEIFEGKHTPLISQKLFTDVQRILDQKIVRKKTKHSHLYSNLLHCTNCGYALPGERQKGHIYYRCHTMACTKTSIREDRLTAHLAHLWQHLTISEPVIKAVMALAEERSQTSRELHKQTQQEQQLQFENYTERISKLTDLLLDSTISKEEYISKKKSLTEKKLAIQAKMQSVDNNDAELKVSIDQLLEPCKDLWSKYEKGSIDKKRRLIRMLTSNLRINQKNVVVELKKAYLTLLHLDTVSESSPRKTDPRTYCQFCNDNNSVSKDKTQAIDEILSSIQNNLPDEVSKTRSE